jgi:hypothetical protein
METSPPVASIVFIEAPVFGLHKCMLKKHRNREEGAHIT